MLSFRKYPVHSELLSHLLSTDSREASSITKIDLTAVKSKPLSKSSRPGDPKRLQSNVEDIRRSRSRSVMQSDVDFTFPPRTTVSNGIVASKPSSKVAGPARKKCRVSKRENSESEGSALGSDVLSGVSEEDDSLERELAMSSPMKGSELQSKKVCFH